MSYVKLNSFCKPYKDISISLKILKMMWPKPTMTMFQKVHTFQASLESVLTQLCEAEVAQKSLTNCDTDPNTFRNQLKVTICPPVIPTVSPAGLEVPPTRA